MSMAGPAALAGRPVGGGLTGVVSEPLVVEPALQVVLETAVEPVRLVRRQPGKRAFDVVVAAGMLVAMMPLFLLVALAIKLEDGGPVLYRQHRVGYRGRPFRILKFRSMTVGAERLRAAVAHRNVRDGLLFKVPNDPRVTAVGRVIRRLSIDELPQFWNVLRGEMSLVGPRPLPVDPDDFSPVDGARHTVAPGITGVWQVTTDRNVTYWQMVDMDLGYIRSWSFRLDLRLLLRTIPAVIHRRGPAY